PILCLRLLSVVDLPNPRLLARDALRLQRGLLPRPGASQPPSSLDSSPCPWNPSGSCEHRLRRRPDSTRPVGRTAAASGILLPDRCPRPVAGGVLSRWSGTHGGRSRPRNPACPGRTTASRGGNRPGRLGRDSPCKPAAVTLLALTNRL